MTEGKLSLQRIMLVEDEEDIRAVAELALEAVGGFTLKTCASGQVALDQLAEFRPQLVLLDVMMPVMDGPQATAEIRGMGGERAAMLLRVFVMSVSLGLLYALLSRIILPGTYSRFRQRVRTVMPGRVERRVPGWLL